MRNRIHFLTVLFIVLFLPFMAPSFVNAAANTSPNTSGDTYTIKGTLFEKGTKTALENVTVFLLKQDQKPKTKKSTPRKTTTDDEGHFTFMQVPEDDYEWVVQLSGYKKFTREDSISVQNSIDIRNFYLEREKDLDYEITIRDKAIKRDQSSKTLKRQEFLNLPGSGGDPIKAVQNLPGVSRAQAFQSQIIIQGSAPKDTRYTIDGHQVPLIFHFGGFSSVVAPEALDRVDYLSAGFGPEYGRAIGGVVGVWTRTPARNRWQGFAFADLLNAGALVEGPISKESGFLITGRQSYIGSVLKAVLKNNKDFNLTVAPTFSDLTTIYQVNPTPSDDVKVVATGSLDRLEFLFSQPIDQDPALRGGFSSTSAFFRVIPQWNHRHNATTQSRWSLGMGKDWIRFNFGEDYFSVNSVAVTARGEVEHQFSKNWISQWGFDHQYSKSHVETLVPETYRDGGISNPFSTGDLKHVTIDPTYLRLGAYWRNEVITETAWKWTFLPSIRGEYYKETKEGFALPRFGIKAQPWQSITWKAATGLYTQPPTEQESDATFGNPSLKSPRAWHYTTGIEKDFRNEGVIDGFTLSSNVFYRDFDQLVIPSTARVIRDGVSVPEIYTNKGRGSAYGLENWLRLNWGQTSNTQWMSWLSYTLSQSRRWNTTNTTAYPFQYDQTHVLTAIAAVSISNSWKFSTRFRYATGNPFTPVTGAIFDSDGDVYVPIRGTYYSERLEPFYQLDFRIDKKWVYDTWIFSMYLDVQNITNRKNIEGARYAYNYGKRATITGLPILPTLGVKAEF